MRRRECIAGFAGLGLSFGRPVLAQQPKPGIDFPTQIVKLVAPFPPGGTVDILSRAIGQQMALTALRAGVIVENRGGAGGTVGADFVARAPADGYTMLFAAAHHAIAQTVYPKLGYDIRRDFAPVGFLGRVNHVLLCTNALPVTTVRELVAYLKANPDKVNYGTPGSGTLHHLMAEQFKLSTGTHMAHVPYKGSGQAMVDLIAGQIQVYFETMPSALQQIRGGSVRALAVTSRERAVSLPGVPTVSEAGVPGFDAASWYGLMVPVRTPQSVVMQLNQALNAAFQNPEFIARWGAFGATPGGGTPDQLGTLMASEVDRWALLSKAANIKVE